MQCQALTKSGTQCSRKAEPNSRFCWQHQDYDEKKAVSSVATTKHTSPKIIQQNSPRNLSPKSSPRNTQAKAVSPRSYYPKVLTTPITNLSNKDMYYVAKLYYKGNDYGVDAFTSLDKLLSYINDELKELAEHENYVFQGQLQREGLGHLSSQFQSSIYSNYLKLNILQDKLNYYVETSYARNILEEHDLGAVAIFKNGYSYVDRNYTVDGKYISPSMPDTIIYPLYFIAVKNNGGYHERYFAYKSNNEKEYDFVLHKIYNQNITLTHTVQDLFTFSNDNSNGINISMYFGGSELLVLVKPDEILTGQYLNIRNIPQELRKTLNFKSSPRGGNGGNRSPLMNM